MTFALLALFSCQEDEIDLFSGSKIVNTYILTWNANTETYYTGTEVDIDFAANPQWADTTIMCGVAISDVLSTEDREIFLSYTGDFDSSLQTELPESVIVPAGEVSASFEVKVKRVEETEEELENIIYVSIKEVDGYTVGPYAYAQINLLTTTSN